MHTCAGVELRDARVKEEKKGENVLKGYKRAGRDRKLIKCGLPRLRYELSYIYTRAVSYASSRKLLVLAYDPLISIPFFSSTFDPSILLSSLERSSGKSIELFFDRASQVRGSIKSR